MYRNLLLAFGLMVAGHNVSAAPVFCPLGTREETQITVTMPAGLNSTESRIYSATELFGSPCYPYVILTEEEDFPPNFDHPTEATQTYPVGTTVRYQSPWMELPGDPSRQARRTTDFERTSTGGCTSANCASSDWLRTGNNVETRARTRPGSLGANDGN